MVRNAISLDYTFRVPSNYTEEPSSEVSLPATINHSTVSTIQSCASSSDSPPWICQKIDQIWRSVCHAIISTCSKIYYWVHDCFVTSYPKINNDISTETLRKLYWGLGRENKWRECIDGRYHDLGKDVFDVGSHGGTVEPGFIGSMEETFTHVERYLNRRVDADWYLGLHRHTCAHFNGDPAAFLMGQEKVGVFRNSDDSIHCHLSGQYSVSAAAKAEFDALNDELRREFGPDYGLGEMIYTNPLTNDVRLNYKPMSRAQVRIVFNKFLTDFYREVESAATPDAKLMAIAKLHQRLEWLHPVRDGTSRTTIATSNKFLTDYGFHPAILEYPHVSSSYTQLEWKNYLQNGLVKWERERARLCPGVLV